VTDQVVATIPKNAREELRVALTEFHGYRLCAMRVYFKPEGGGDMRPGKNGLNVRIEQIPDIIEALQQALAQSRGRS
jgi:hypothetical protein